MTEFDSPIGESDVRGTIGRYWSFVDRRGPDECWPWLGKRTPVVDGRGGYGRFSVDGVVVPSTHFALALAGRFVAEGQLAMHACDNPPCVNPSHLTAGSAFDNMRDMVAKGRDNPWLRRRNTCMRGHEFTPDNTFTERKRPNYRGCKRCRADANARYRGRQRAAARIAVA